MTVEPPKPDHESDHGRAGRASVAGETESAAPRPTKTLTSQDKVAATDIPKRVGQYHIKRLIASGGMGVVYAAEQDNPRRTVALKVIRPGYASRSALRRYGAGSAGAGPPTAPRHRPDLRGGNVRRRPRHPAVLRHGVHSRRHPAQLRQPEKLGTRERLGLLAAVCDGVHHAHQKGVVHRDLKPGNILVNEAGQPKILDFGVARVTDSDIQVTTMQTDVGQLIGTLPYMSPEQIAADPDELDARSDVYALGVIAYELLAGHLPYDLRQKLIHEAARIIREDDPTPLSSVNKVFRGDIETIVAKAMEKDKTPRDQSASGLAGDIRRYLRDEPIVARPPSTFYQLGKFTKRNKALVGGVVAVFVVLAAGELVSGTQYLRAERRAEEARGERDEAETQAAKATEVKDFITGMLSSIDPSKARDMDKTLLHMILDDASERISEELQGQPLVEDEIHATIGEAYRTLGEYARAKPHLKRALELRRTHLGDNHQDTFSAIHNLGFLLRSMGKYVEGETLLLEAYADLNDHPKAKEEKKLQALNHIIELYDAWHTADPGKGYDVKAAEWRAKLPEAEDVGSP